MLTDIVFPETNMEIVEIPDGTLNVPSDIVVSVNELTYEIPAKESNWATVV